MRSDNFWVANKECGFLGLAIFSTAGFGFNADTTRFVSNAEKFYVPIHQRHSGAVNIVVSAWLVKLNV